MECYLELEDKTVFKGRTFGKFEAKQGKIYVVDSCHDYEKKIHDEAFKDAILVFTYPGIGNMGVNGKTDAKTSCAALVVGDFERQPSHWEMQETLEEHMVTHNIAGIWGLDTRALTRYLQSHGTMTATLTLTKEEESK